MSSWARYLLNAKFTETQIKQNPYLKFLETNRVICRDANQKQVFNHEEQETYFCKLDL